MSLDSGGHLSSPLPVAGLVIRYAFYLIGAVVMGIIGLSILTVWRALPTPINDAPAMRIAEPSISRLPVSGHVLTSGRFGRIEVRQYGQLHNRGTDLAVVLVMPPRGIGMGTVFAQDLRELNLLRSARAVMSSTHYDLDTRFGEFRATEMRVETDGRWKQCLAYRSRLDTAAVYLTGWYCDGSGARPSANVLACILDRLVIDTELASKEADTFLRTQMAHPPLCAAEQVTQTMDVGGRRMSPPSRWSQPNTVRRY